MTFGSATLTAAAAALLATFVWWLCGRLALPLWVGMFLFGLVLLLVFATGPLVRLP